MGPTATNSRDGRKLGVLTREEIISALRDYAGLYGNDFTSACFNPATAKWQDREDAIERYYAGNPRTGKPWPSLNSIRDHFGGFSAAREAAGFVANRPGPSRRAAGKHRPIRDVRDRRIVEPNERAVQLERAVERAVRRAEKAEAKVAELRARPDVVRERVKVKEKIVRVKDERAVARLKDKLADEVARVRAVEAQLSAAVRDLDRARVRVDEASVALSEARRDASDAERGRKIAEDRLVATEARMGRLVEERDAATTRVSEASETAIATDFVREAERRADEAEIRAARAEREMAEQAAAITGQMRRLTAAEMAGLRSAGPSGPAVLAEALGQLAKARRVGGKTTMLGEALGAVASAAIRWRDRL